MTSPDHGDRPAAGPAGPDVAATFCATLADEWARLGVTDVVVSPGSRSTPLALAFSAEPRLTVHVHHDERSASFLALGLALASGRAVVVVTTSGTAAVELHPAIVEAHHSGVPLIAATADRPPELQDVGAPQTIDQVGLYGRSVRGFHQPGVPEWSTRHSWRELAQQALAEAEGAAADGVGPGPVHLNLAFREPLLGTVLELPTAVGATATASTASPTADAGPDPEWLDELRHPMGVIVAGRGAGSPGFVHEVAHALGWPVLADPLSGCHQPAANTVTHWDGLLRVPEFVARHRPAVVLRLGALPASKVLAQWLGGLDAFQVAVAPHGAVFNPDGGVSRFWSAAPDVALAALLSRGGPSGPAADGARAEPGWLAGWREGSAQAAAAVDTVLKAQPGITEPGVARSVSSAMAEVGGDLVVSSSMPIRDLEWFGAPVRGSRVLANRGANGIDGVVSTAVGVALDNAANGDERATALLIGDVALLHDTNGLLGLAGRGASLTIVVIDNDGGGIFSFLPQRVALPTGRFERLFGTPHRVDLAGLAAAHGLEVSEPDSLAALDAVLAGSLVSGGARVVLVRTDRTDNVELHGQLNAAIAAAVAGVR